ncbi:MAG TPA: MFS transporter, partial [Amphiplicatus sp.]|nr:MFS transporter [Amphiplicatus sp.]
MSEENGARRNGQSKSEGVHSDVYVALVVLLLSVAMAFSLVDRFALSLLFEPIKADLGLSDTRLGLLHGVAFGIFYAAVGLPLGQLVDVWSRKWTIFWGLAIWSLATMACGFANDFSMLLLMRIGVGVGEAALAPAGYSI